MPSAPEASLPELEPCNAAPKRPGHVPSGLAHLLNGQQTWSDPPSVYGQQPVLVPQYKGASAVQHVPSL